MSMMKKITLGAAALLVVLSAIVLFANRPFLLATSGFGTFVVTILVFLVVGFFAFRQEEASVSMLVLIAILMVVPIRGFICAADFSPFEDITVELVSYEEDALNRGDSSSIRLRYTNSTGVYLGDVSGVLDFYDGDNLIASYDIRTNTTFPSELEGMEKKYMDDLMLELAQDRHICDVIHELEGSLLCGLDWSTLRIEYTFTSVQFDDAGAADFTFDPITVRLK